MAEFIVFAAAMAAAAVFDIRKMRRAGQRREMAVYALLCAAALLAGALYFPFPHRLRVVEAMLDLMGKR